MKSRLLFLAAVVFLSNISNFAYANQDYPNCLITELNKITSAMADVQNCKAVLSDVLTHQTIASKMQPKDAPMDEYRWDDLKKCESSLPTDLAYFKVIVGKFSPAPVSSVQRAPLVGRMVVSYWHSLGMVSQRFQELAPYSEKISALYQSDPRKLRSAILAVANEHCAAMAKPN